jgi:hypothetical protein
VLALRTVTYCTENEETPLLAGTARIQRLDRPLQQGSVASSIYNASTEEPVDLISVALIATLRLCPVLGMASEGRLAAIVDFTFNLGPGRLQTSTLRRRLNQANWEGAAEELQRWVIAEAGYFPGLLLEKPRSYF